MPLNPMRAAAVQSSRFARSEGDSNDSTDSHSASGAESGAASSTDSGNRTDSAAPRVHSLVRRLAGRISQCLTANTPHQAQRQSSYETTSKSLGSLSQASRNRLCLTAAARGQLPLLRSLVDAGASVEFRDETNISAIHLAVGNDQAHVIQEMVALGWGVNLQDNLQRTPLFIAVEQRRHDCVVALLECGADPNLTDFRNWTPMHLAASVGQTETIRLLLDHGATLNPLSRTRDTPCDLAMIVGALESAQLLFEAGGVIREETIFDSRLFTPLNRVGLAHMATVVSRNQFNQSIDLSVQFPNLIGNPVLLGAIAERRQLIQNQLRAEYASLLQLMESGQPEGTAPSIGTVHDQHALIAQYALDGSAKALSDLLFPDYPMDRRPGLLRSLIGGF